MVMERLSRYAILLVGFWQVLVLFSESPWESYIRSSLNDMQRDLQTIWSEYQFKLDWGYGSDSDMVLNSSNPVHCYNSSYCCGQWNVNADHWSQHHPHWEVVLETETTFCLSPIQDPNRTAMLQHLHWTQWNIDITDDTLSDDLHALSTVLPSDYNYTVNCSNLCTTVSISSGYGASLQFLFGTFWFAFTRDLPYQIIKRGPWLYAMSNANHSWAYCHDQDISCLFLPLSPCSRYQPEQPKIARRPDNKNATQMMQGLWLRDYLIRPQQKMRYELFKLKQPYLYQLEIGCIAMHVRRSDVGIPQPPFRRYAAVQEYLSLLPSPNGTGDTKPTIFLLTDDATTIDEVHQYHMGNNSRYNWVYTQKNRNRGVEQGFDGHIPKQSDGPQELLYITLEQELASKYCRALVHGNSGYANTLWEKMQLKNPGKIQRYELDTRIPKAEAAQFRGPHHRAQGFVKRQEHLLNQVSEFNTMNSANT